MKNPNENEEKTFGESEGLGDRLGDRGDIFGEETLLLFRRGDTRGDIRGEEASFKQKITVKKINPKLRGKKTSTVGTEAELFRKSLRGEEVRAGGEWGRGALCLTMGDCAGFHALWDEFDEELFEDDWLNVGRDPILCTKRKRERKLKSVNKEIMRLLDWYDFVFAHLEALEREKKELLWPVSLSS